MWRGEIRAATIVAATNTGEKAIIGIGWMVAPLEGREQFRRNYFDNVSYSVFHKRFIFTIVWL